VRYLAGYQHIPHVPGIENLPFVSFPRRPAGHPPASWVVYEIPDVNIGNYSPTEVMTAQSAADTVDTFASPNFDFSRQAVLSAEIRDRLVLARDVKLSVIRGGFIFQGAATAPRSSSCRNNSPIACALTTSARVSCAPI
jgi:hypothetical protein